MCCQWAWVSLTMRRKPWKVLSHRNMSQGPVRMLPGHGGRLLCRQLSWHFCAVWSQWSSLSYLATSLHPDSQGGPFWPFQEGSVKALVCRGLGRFGPVSVLSRLPRGVWPSQHFALRGKGLQHPGRPWFPSIWKALGSHSSGGHRQPHINWSPVHVRISWTRSPRFGEVMLEGCPLLSISPLAGKCCQVSTWLRCGEWALRWAIPVLVQAQPPPGHVPLWWFLMCMSASNAQLCALHASPHPVLHHCRRRRYFYPLWQRNKRSRKVDDLPGWLHQIVKSPELMLLGSPLLLWQVASAGWPWFPRLKDGWWGDL